MWQGGLILAAGRVRQKKANEENKHEILPNQKHTTKSTAAQ